MDYAQNLRYCNVHEKNITLILLLNTGIFFAQLVNSRFRLSLPISSSDKYNFPYFPRLTVKGAGCGLSLTVPNVKLSPSYTVSSPTFWPGIVCSPAGQPGHLARQTLPGNTSLHPGRKTHTHTHTNTLTQQIIPLFANPVIL